MFNKEKLKAKLKKKLKAFLTDESGKITKKDAL
jgi:flagellar basal body-associated protein FliL